MDQLDTPNNEINSFNSYNVVDNAFFHQSQELMLAFFNNKCTVSPYCLHTLNTEYIHMLISEEEKKIVIIPSAEFEPESIKWTSANSTIRPRQLKCPIFFALVMDLMNWDPTCKYKLIGTLKQTPNERILVFDLTQPEIYMRLTSEHNRHTYTSQPYLTQDWKNRFGITFENMKKNVTIRQHAEYTVIELPERS